MDTSQRLKPLHHHQGYRELISELQSRTCELLAWAKTMLPGINQSVRDARAQLQTVIKTFAVSFQEQQWSPRTTQQHSNSYQLCSRPIAPTLDIRQHLQKARTQIATISSDVREYFPSIADL
jgi:hypothetical protein